MIFFLFPSFIRNLTHMRLVFCQNERLDLNNLLFVVTTRLKEKLPGSILSRAPPPPAKNPYLTSDRKATIGEGGIVNSADREAFASFGEEKWRAEFLLKRSIDLEEVKLNSLRQCCGAGAVVVFCFSKNLFQRRKNSTIYVPYP
jgi:hypothetical protein